MYLCICHAVTDEQIELAVDGGAHTLAEVSLRTGAGRSCATCHDSVEDLIDDRCGTCPLAAVQAAAQRVA